MREASSLSSVAVDPDGSDGYDQTGHEEYYQLQALKQEIEKDKKELQELERAAEQERAEAIQERAEAMRQLNETMEVVRNSPDLSESSKMFYGKPKAQQSLGTLTR